jgi:hypothetical protein
MRMHAVAVCMRILTDVTSMRICCYCYTILHYIIYRGFALPACALYNAASGHFVCALRNTLHMWSAATGTHTRRMPLLIPSHFRYTDKHSISGSNNSSSSGTSNTNSSNSSSGAASNVQHVTSHSVTSAGSNGSGGPLGVTVDGETAVITCAALALPHERRLVYS